MNAVPSCGIICVLSRKIKLKNFMNIPTTRPSDSFSQKWKSIFSFLLGPFPTLFTVNGLSVALLMRSLVLCNQVLSELRRVHFTGSQGTRSNQNAVFPPVCNNTTITFHHCCAVIHSWRKAGTREQTNKHTDRQWNQRGITEPEDDSLLCLFLSVYLCQLHWNGCNFAVPLSKKCALFKHAVSSYSSFLCYKQNITLPILIYLKHTYKLNIHRKKSPKLHRQKKVNLSIYIPDKMLLSSQLSTDHTHRCGLFCYLCHIFIHVCNRRSGLWWSFCNYFY